MTGAFADKSFWLSSRPYSSCPVLAGDTDVDVAIIGGGFTGLSTAWLCKQAEPSLRVAILEAEVIGYGASGRNGGFSMTKLGMMHSVTKLRFGRARTIEAHEYADRAVTLVQGLVDELGFDCDHEHPGFLWVATSQTYARRLHAELDLIDDLGIGGVEHLDATGWSGREGIGDFRSLVHYTRLTADNRILFGGRDVGLGKGGTMDFDRDETMFAKLRADLVTTWPVLRGIGFTHAWGGPVSVPLDLFPAIGHAGGRDWVYSLGCVGHGVSTTHLHGQALADLVLERDTDLTRTFFVDRKVPPRPPEPLRRTLIRAMDEALRWDDRRHDVMPG